MNILTAAQVRAVEDFAVKNGLSTERMMENAGAAATRVIKERFELNNKRVIIVTGQGNNGGDGFVVARKLKEYGARVTVVTAVGITVTANCTLMQHRAQEQQISMLYYHDDPTMATQLFRSADLLVDAIFGIGFHGAPEQDLAVIIEAMNACSAPIVALDIPSGVCCDDGAVHGVAVRADVTVSFISYKPCHFLKPAMECCGTTVCSTIGVNEQDAVPKPYAKALTIEEALDSLQPVPDTAHKGTMGTVLVVGGSYGMAGAPVIAGRAAAHSGAGLVRLCVPDSVYNITGALIPEAVFTPLPDANGHLSRESFAGDRVLQGADAVVIGPGMGCNTDTAGAVQYLLQSVRVPCVVDADALNVLAEEPELFLSVKAPIVVTPHPGEMARLLGISVTEVQSDRIACARDFAEKYGVITVLKGAYTVIAEPSGRVTLNTTGNAGMATAGSGDMLAGMLAAFMANGSSPYVAAAAAVCLHGAVGDLTRDRLSARGMSVSDMLVDLPRIFK